MDIKEYSERALNSARQYWRFLEKHRKGLITYDVKSIDIVFDEIGHSILLLTLLDNTKPVKFPDSLFILIDGKTSLAKEFNILSITEDGLQLTVESKPELINFVNTLSTARIKVASDLKFLVQRIGEWYKNHGLDIIHPTQIRLPPANSPFSMEHCETPITKDQENALLSIFEHTFTYIWGAPGTGKTKCVLSHAIIHCIKNICTEAGDKIIVTAPTNNAVDQTLFGIIPMLEKSGIDRTKVLRLGTPTVPFASKYPDVCETFKESRKTKQLSTEIEDIKNSLSKKKLAEEHLSFLESFEVQLKEYAKFLEKYQSLNLILFNTKFEQSELSEQIEDLNKDKKRLTLRWKQLTAFWYYLTHNFIPSRRKNYKNEIADITNDFESIHHKISDIEAKINSKQLQIDELTASENEARDELYALKSSIRSVAKHAPFSFNRFLRAINNFECYTPDRLLNSFQIFKESIILEFNSVPNFGTPTNKLLEQLFQKEELLRQLTTHSAFESATIIAGTIDTIVGKYDMLSVKSNTHIKHVFIDEAAYTPAIKAMITFSFRAPVTFLGDHMQLPPVCEMNETALKSDENHDVILWTLPATYCGNAFSDAFASLYEDYENKNEARFDLIYKSDLNYTHRFGNNLAQLLAKYAYTHKFCGNNDTHVIIRVLDAKRQTQKGRENICEAQVITEYLKSQKLSDVAIITPYKAQVELLQKTALGFAKSIMTVHSSQGKEYDTVILSVCDTTNMWFTDSQNKISDGLKVINTAISRAKKELIIVCDESFWITQSKQLIAELIKRKEPS